MYNLNFVMAKRRDDGNCSEKAFFTFLMKFFHEVICIFTKLVGVSVYHTIFLLLSTTH